MRRAHVDAGDAADGQEVWFGQDARAMAVPAAAHAPLGSIDGPRRPQAPLIMSWWLQGSDSYRRAYPSSPPHIVSLGPRLALFGSPHSPLGAGLRAGAPRTASLHACQPAIVRQASCHDALSKMLPKRLKYKRRSCGNI
jgi:hypothetical protein